MSSRSDGARFQFKVATTFVLMFIVGGLPLDAARANNSAAPVEAYVQEHVDAGVKILQDKSRSENERHAKLREFLLSLLDLKRIAFFTLGSWRRNTAQTDVDDFVGAFREFALANYESKISDYGGQRLKVTGSRKNADNDYVVTANLVDPGETNAGELPLEVDLRVLDENGKFVVVDASVEGIWLALTQRADYSGFLSQHNGDVKALAGLIRQRAAMLLAGGAATKSN